ncbi:MAG: patatin-like phospholipase family protein [Deltaproteobacteria bacterium]|nr:patatin-like phospholipase family protein [Deltaproteobacteria bacterium]MCB9786427.1 patatin-like phospholipase family protein [Deltaproteobacteria bacterium]
MARRCIAALVLLASAPLALGGARGARAGDDIEAEPEVRLHEGVLAQALTISGGVSLGVYQAGFLYLNSQWLSHNGERVRLRLATGASAGSINAVIAAMSACMPPQDDPRESLGWHTWMPMSYARLFRPDEVTAVSAFSRKPMQDTVERLRGIWRSELSVPCDVVIGVTATRLEPEEVSASGLTVPRQEEKFVLRLRSRGEGKPPEVTNFVTPDDAVPRPLLVLPEGPGAGDAAFDALKSLLFASSAFPLAFPPEPVSYCLSQPSAGSAAEPSRVRCTEPEHTAEFVDGGVFDNSPLGLAQGLIGSHLRASSGKGIPGWKLDDGRGHRDASRVRLTFVDPDAAAYPAFNRPADEDADAGPRALIRTATQLAAAFVRTARAQQLYGLVDGQEGLATAVHSSSRNFPTLSTLLYAFFGFFERELRRFDFYLGMYDAWRYLNLDTAEPGSVDVAPWLSDAGRPIPEGWRPFACMVGWYEESAPWLREACAGEELRDFRILVQVSIDRLYAVCAPRGEDPPPLERPHYHCERARAGAAPPHLDGVPTLAADAWRIRKGESTFDHAMRLLAGYRFHFADLHLAPKEARFGPIKLRRRLLSILNAIADAQPSASGKTLLLTAGRVALNSFAYEPPKEWGYLVIGNGLETGISFLPFDWNRSWMRFNAAFQLRGLRSLLTPDDVQVAMALTAGPEFELLFMTTPVIQPMLGLRGGYQLGTGDRFHARSCTTGRASGDNRFCSQALLQAYVAVSILERFRMQVTFEQYPERPAFGSRRFDLRFGFGIHFF